MIRDFDQEDSGGTGSKRLSRAAVIGLLIGAEVLAVALTYQFLVVFECQQSDMFAACRFLRSLVARFMVMSAILIVIARLKPLPFRKFSARSQGHRAPWFLFLHLLGGLILLLPLVFLWGPAGPQSFAGPLVLFTLGGGISAIGALFWLAPRPAWLALFHQVGPTLVAALAIGFVLPDLAVLSEPVWQNQALTIPTFIAVNALLQLTGQTVYLDPEAVVLGLDHFKVNIASNCSGIEGLALVTILSAIYGWLFRADIRIGRYVATVLPLALLTSWIFNAVRIAALVMVGEYISPEVAVDGFHSYAGWLFFTLLSLMLIAIVHRVKWLHKWPGAVPTKPMRHSLVPASLVPFAVFMITLTLLSAVLPKPELGMPVVTITVGIALLVFAPALMRLNWRMDVLSILAGFAIALLWLVTAPEAEGTLSADLLVLHDEERTAYLIWAGLRILGTALCVPLAEELLFRGYLMSRISAAIPGKPALKTAAAVIATTLAFAFMHQRWEVAGVSGLVFAALALRNGRVTDAILAHVTANATIGIVAFLSFDWSLI